MRDTFARTLYQIAKVDPKVFIVVADISPAALDFAFLGLPAYGEDSQLLPTLDSAASPLLARDRYRCGNDAVCGWAGALACQDGINIVAGTGSIAYGEFEGRSHGVVGPGSDPHGPHPACSGRV